MVDPGRLLDDGDRHKGEESTQTRAGPSDTREEDESKSYKRRRS